MIALRDLILIAANPFRDTAYQTSKAIYEMLEQAGHRCCICPVFSEEQHPATLEGFFTAGIDEVAAEAKLSVVLGGDGTILFVADLLRRLEVPIAGVNLGGKGFLTAMEANEIERLLPIAAGECTISRRMMLEVSLIRNGEVLFCQSVLNDVIVHGAQAECIGIMVMEPDNENIIVTPICPHSMVGKSYVLLPSRVVTIEPERIHDRPAILSADGNKGVPLVSGDKICVKRSDRSILLAETGANSFFDRAFEKLSGYGEG